MTRLTERQITERLARLRGWSRAEGGRIAKTYILAGFPQALMLVNAAGFLAEAAQHHPDILVEWNRVTFSLTTHDAGGLTDKDFDLAARIDSLPITL